MSTTDPAAPRAATRRFGGPGPTAYPPEGEGWVLFAGTVLGVLAILNIIDGIAAISSSKFFVGQAQFVFSGLNTWGWIILAVGAVQGVASAGVFLRWPGVRWVGVGIAGLNAIAQLLFMPAYPLWAMSLFALDILVIYGLIAHGGPRN